MVRETGSRWDLPQADGMIHQSEQGSLRASNIACQSDRV